MATKIYTLGRIEVTLGLMSLRYIERIAGELAIEAAESQFNRF